MSGTKIRTEIYVRFSEAYGDDETPERAERMLNAAMAAAALIAVADGHASFEEGAAAGHIADVVQSLRLFDPLTGVKLYHDYVHLAQQGDAGREKLLDIVQAVADDPDERDMLIEICHAISRADGIVVPEESREIWTIEAYLQLRANKTQ